MTTDLVVHEIDRAKNELMLAHGDVRRCRQPHRTSTWLTVEEQKQNQDKATKRLMAARQMIDFAITKLGNLPLQMEPLE